MSELAIGILSDPGSWINEYLPSLVETFEVAGHQVETAHRIDELSGGDICFLLSVSEIISARQRARYTHNLVVHESDLPKGRGWSPMTWQILEGADSIPITLIEAADKVDSGVIYGQKVITLTGTELSNEWRAHQAQATFALCVEFVGGFPQTAHAARQQAGKPSYYPRRTAADSRLDPEKSIAEQFDLLRVVDNDRYPAFFEHRGHRFILKIERDDRE